MGLLLSTLFHKVEAVMNFSIHRSAFGQYTLPEKTKGGTLSWLYLTMILKCKIVVIPILWMMLLKS